MSKYFLTVQRKIDELEKEQAELGNKFLLEEGEEKSILMTMDSSIAAQIATLQNHVDTYIWNKTEISKYLSQKEKGLISNLELIQRMAELHTWLYSAD